MVILAIHLVWMANQTGQVMGQVWNITYFSWNVLTFIKSNDNKNKTGIFFIFQVKTNGKVFLSFPSVCWTWVLLTETIFQTRNVTWPGLAFIIIFVIIQIINKLNRTKYIRKENINQVVNILIDLCWCLYVLAKVIVYWNLDHQSMTWIMQVQINFTFACPKEMFQANTFHFSRWFVNLIFHYFSSFSNFYFIISAALSLWMSFIYKCTQVISVF